MNDKSSDEIARGNLNVLIQTALEQERNRIQANILSRVSDLNACSKRDNCNELARLIESYIPEWLEGENK